MCCTAILANITILEVGQFYAFHDVCGCLKSGLAVIGMDQGYHRLANQFLLGITKNPFTTGADVYKVSVCINNTNSVQQQIHIVAEGIKCSGGHGRIRFRVDF